jgi:hypothetical protein
LNAGLWVRRGVNTPETVKALAADSAKPAAPMTPGEFQTKFSADYAGLEKLIKIINVHIQ